MSKKDRGANQERDRAFRLPRCPYCGMHFTYKRVVSGRLLGSRDCPHCKKSYRAALSASTWLLLLFFFILCVLLNTLLLRTLNVNAVFISFLSLFLTIPTLFMIPLTVRYRDRDGRLFEPKEREMLGRMPRESKKPEQSETGKQGRKRTKSERIRERKEGKRR